MSNPKTYPVYVVHGPERYIQHQSILEITRSIFGDDPHPIGLSEFTKDEADLAVILDELRTLPMLADRRLVIVRDADPFISKWRGGLEKYCEAPLDTATLLLVCKTFDARTRLAKIVQKTGQVIKCAPPRGQALLGWITRQSNLVYDKTLDNAAAMRLRESVGDDLGTLDAELNKLSIYVGDRKRITGSDVDVLVGHHREEQIWGITDAIAVRDAKTALKLWEQVLATDRAAPARAVAGLAWGIRRLLEAKQLASDGVGMAELARKFWTDPNALSRRLAGFNSEQLQQQLGELLQIDVNAKSGLETVQSGIEKFIISQCTLSAKSTAG